MRLYICIIVLLSLNSGVLFAQVQTPSLWYKAETYNTQAKTWEYNGIEVKDAGRISSEVVNLVEKVQNFNPILRFNSREKNCLYKDNIASHSFLSERKNTVLIVQNLKNNGVSFQFGAKSDHRLGTQFVNAGKDIRFDFPNDRSGQIVNTYPGKGQMCIWELVCSDTYNSFYVNGGHKSSKRCSDTFGSKTGDDLRIGRTSFSSIYAPNDAYYADLDLAEIVIFNTELTDQERKVWESYLGIKYSLVMNGGNYTYTSSDNVEIWRADANFKTNIFGIGRDLRTGLNQRISAPLDKSITVSTEHRFDNRNNSLSQTLSDKQYLMIADNGKSGAGKIWKVRNTGAGKVYVKIDEGAWYYSAPKYLWIDNDDDFTNGITEIVKLCSDGSCEYTFPEGISYMKLSDEGMFLKTWTIKDEFCEGESIDINVDVYCYDSSFGFDIYADISNINPSGWITYLYPKTKHYSGVLPFDAKDYKNLSFRVFVTKDSFLKKRGLYFNIHPLIHTTNIKKNSVTKV